MLKRLDVANRRVLGIQGLEARSHRGWFVLIASLLAFMLTACSPTTVGELPQADAELLPTRTPAPLPTLTSVPTEPAPTLVSIWLDWEYEELQGLYAVIEKYQQINPAVAFAITYRPRNLLLEAFETAAAQGQAPSILLGPSSWGPALREQGYILNLSPLLDPGMESDVHPIAWTQAAEGTQLFGLPLELQGVVLYRNRSLVAQPVADIDEWLQIASELDRGGRDALVLDLELEISLPLAAACGQEVFGVRGELQVFDAGGECWLQLLRRIGDLGDIVFGTDEDVELFKRGQAAWLIASTEVRHELVEAIGVTNLEVDPWPVYGQTGYPLRGFSWSENVYLVAGSTESDLEATWDFVQYLFGINGQTILSDPGGAAHIPTTSALDPPDSLMLASSSMLRAGIPFPMKNELDLVQEPLIAAIQAVVLQGADPGFALRLAEERLELLNSGRTTP